MRDKWRVALGRAMDYWYWRGVLEQAGSRSAVEALRPDGTCHDATPPLEIDLANGLAWCEARIDAERPASLCVRLDGRLVGIEPASPGAEPLRGVHLRARVSTHMWRGYVHAAAAAGLMPEVLANAVRDTVPSAAAPATAPTGQAA